MFIIHHLLAGAWATIWHWGAGVALIIICLLCAFGTTLIAGIPVIGLGIANALAPLRKDFIIAAALVALFLAGMYVGAKDTALHHKAQQMVIVNHVNSVVDTVVNSPQNKPQPQKYTKKGHKPIPRKSPRDRWDNPRN
jgi:hypothetical protein